MNTVTQPDSHIVDVNMAWEMAQIENTAFDQVQELASRSPISSFGRFVCRGTVARIDQEIEGIWAGLEDKQAEIEKTITANRKHIYPITSVCEPFDRDVYRAYRDQFTFEEHYRQIDANPASQGVLRNIGEMYCGESGSHSVLLFDSSAPKRQAHGMQTQATLEALGFAPSQFEPNIQTDERGITTSSATIQPGLNIVGEESIPSVGRTLTATYTRTNKDVRVELTVLVEDEAPEVIITLPKHLKDTLWDKPGEHACGSIWPGSNGYEGKGERGMTTAIRQTQEFLAFGGQLTEDQECVYHSMWGYRDYLRRPPRSVLRSKY